MNFPRRTKETKPMGMKRPKSAYHQTLSSISPKGAQRVTILRRKLKQMLNEFDLKGMRPHCQKCGTTTKKFVADHVQTRNEFDADRFENLGVLCVDCNLAKGSVREEYRQSWFIKRMQELDREAAKIEHLRLING